MIHRPKISISQLPSLKASKDQSVKLHGHSTHQTQVQAKLKVGNALKVIGLQKKSSKENQKAQLPQQRINKNGQAFNFKYCCQNYLGMGKQNEQKKINLGVDVAKNLPKNIEQIDKRVENLIRQRLKKLASLKGKNILELQTKEFEDEFLNQIEQIVKQIQKVKTLEQSEDEIQKIGRKIVIMEKLIAQSSVQSQLLKKLYYYTVTYKQSLDKPSENAIKVGKLAKSKEKMFFKSAVQKNQCQLKRHQSLVTFESINQQNFKKPTEEAYKKQSCSKEKYMPNKLMTGTSTYNTEFTSYGPFSHYIQPKEKYVENTISQKLSSSYQSAFKNFDKKPQKIKYQDLDCCRDKMQNIRMSFMNICKKNYGNKTSLYQKQTQNTNNRDMQLTNSSMLNQTCLSHLLGPFKNNSEQQLISTNFSRSFIKDKSLENLKVQYKNVLRS